MRGLYKDRKKTLRHGYVIAGLFLLFAIGCATGNTLHIIPLNYNDIDTTNPMLMKINPDECYFWINDDDEICITLKQKNFSLLGEAFERELHLSLVLSGQPAGSARLYRATRKTMRNRYRAGYGSSRSTSLAGIVAIWDYKKDSLHGRFRIVARQQLYSILSGWGNHRNVLFVGEFTARKNKNKGWPILTYTEEDELSRELSTPAPKPVQGPPRQPSGKVIRIPKKP